ncbi:MAG TPA: rod shape-determining protein MreC [Acidimicrobiales bacterium]|nr:rod shape-determining protein MreC [Acidimicrobiales bacterium]
MAVYRRSSRTRYVVAVLVLAALTLVTIDARSNGSGVTADVRSKVQDVFSPLQRATHAVLRPIGDFLTGAVDYGSLKRENQRLRDQVASLERLRVQFAAEQAAAEQVLAERNLSFVGGIPTVTVQVIDDGSSNFETFITINKGADSGIASGQPVVAAGGLVGSIESVSAHTATVLLLTNPSYVVGVRLAGGNTGSVEGTGRGRSLNVSVITTNQPSPAMTKGEPVVTSGLNNEKFPPNIPVGKVLSAKTPPGASEPDITLTPLVNLNRLSYLQVLLWSPQ